MIPAAVRAAIAEHARAELPNEACGLLLLDGDQAVEYVPGENASPSPYFFELRLDPVDWADIGDRDGGAGGDAAEDAFQPEQVAHGGNGLLDGDEYLPVELRDVEDRRDVPVVERTEAHHGVARKRLRCGDDDVGERLADALTGAH